MDACRFVAVTSTMAAKVFNLYPKKVGTAIFVTLLAKSILGSQIWEANRVSTYIFGILPRFELLIPNTLFGPLGTTNVTIWNSREVKYKDIFCN